MDQEIFYVVVDGKLQRAETEQSLPASFLNAVPTNIAAILDTPAMTIGGWEDSTEGPLALALDSNGEVTAIVAVNADQIETTATTLQSIDTWLSTMRLRDLGDLSGNHTAFYEGLLDLSPDSSIALASTRHYVLLTALDELPIDKWSALLPDARISIRFFDAVCASGHPAMVRSRSALDRSLRAPSSDASTIESEPPSLPNNMSADKQTEQPPGESAQDVPTPPVVDFSPVEIPRIDIAPPDPMPEELLPLDPWMDQSESTNRIEGFSVAAEPDGVSIEADVIDLVAAGADPKIDLDDPLVNGLIDDTETPPVPETTLSPGATYALNRLPLLFDPTGESLTSISDELFAVDNDIVLVVKLPERRRATPFEERDRFRWDTSLDRVQLLNTHGTNSRGEQRVAHLFVESDRQPEYAAYVGVLERTDFQTKTNSETAWFSVEPPLSADLHRLLKRGRLPQHAGQEFDSPSPA